MATHRTWADCAGKVAIDDAGRTLGSGADSPPAFDAAFSPLAFDSSGGSVSSIDFTTQGAGSSQDGAVPGAAVATTSVAAIPEPHTNLLMLAGLAAIGFMATRRRRP